MARGAYTVTMAESEKNQLGLLLMIFFVCFAFAELLPMVQQPQQHTPALTSGRRGFNSCRPRRMKRGLACLLSVDEMNLSPLQKGTHLSVSLSPFWKLNYDN